jgi:hypothetical protein
MKSFSKPVDLNNSANLSSMNPMALIEAAAADANGYDLVTERNGTNVLFHLQSFSNLVPFI